MSVDTLKPCPMCGGTASIKLGSFSSDGNHDTPTVVYCNDTWGCGTRLEMLPDHGERNCYWKNPDSLGKEHMYEEAAERWNRRYRKTCKAILRRDQGADEIYGEPEECSECGSQYIEEFDFCPACGAEVVERTETNYTCTMYPKVDYKHNVYRECSNCRESVPYDPSIQYDECPHCGATVKDE